MWECFISVNVEARKIPADATREKQQGTQSQWQQESPCKELEQLKENCGCRLWSPTVAARHSAMMNGILVSGPSKEFVEPSRKKKSTDFLRRIIDGMGGNTFLHACPHYNSPPLEDYFWWVSTGHGDCNNKKEGIAAGGVRLVEAISNRERQTRIVVQIGVDANEAKVFKAHAAPYNLINALKLLANQQKDGDKPNSKHRQRPARKM